MDPRTVKLSEETSVMIAVEQCAQVEDKSREENDVRQAVGNDGEGERERNG